MSTRNGGADKTKKEGTKEVLKGVLNPRQAGGVKVTPEIGKQRPTRNAGIVARRTTRRASAGRNALIRKNPDPDGPNKEISSDHTTLKDRKDPEKSERGQPS